MPDLKLKTCTLAKNVKLKEQKKIIILKTFSIFFREPTLIEIVLHNFKTLTILIQSPGRHDVIIIGQILMQQIQKLYTPGPHHPGSRTVTASFMCSYARKSEF